ncbi:MAG: hypothetical protein Q9178_002501 [Gyalolechia marmorata]
MPDTQSDPFFAPFNFVVDHNGLLPGFTHIQMPPSDSSRLWQEPKYMQPSMARNDSMASSWSMQDVVAPDGTTANHLMSRLDSRDYATANSMIGPLPTQAVPDSDPLMFSGSKDATDFDAFCKDQNMPLFQDDVMDQSTNVSRIRSLDFPISPGIFSSSRGSCTISGTSGASHQQGSNFDHRQAPHDIAHNGCTNSYQSCLSSSLEILHSLHIPPTGCLSSVDEISTSANNREPRKTDTVLATNRTAVRRLSEISRCSCVSSSQLQLVLVIICDKLIAWYRAVLRSSPDHNQDQQMLDFEAKPSSALSGPERVLYQRFAMGNCSFDTGLESCIFAQVISFELQQLENLIQDLDTRLQNEGVRGVESTRDRQRERRASAINAPGLPSPVCKRLTAHLLKEVEEIKLEIARDK